MKNNNFNFIFLHVKILTGGIMFKNTLDNKRYYTLNYFFKKKFGQKVFKVPIDINSTCPNQVNGGCIYCSNKSTASISDGNLDILEQFENGKKIMEQKWPDSLFS